jgi:hypothetical protein
MMTRPPGAKVNAVARQVVLDVGLDAQARVAEVILAAEAGERPQVPRLPWEGVEVDEPLVDPVPEGVAHGSGASVRDPTIDHRGQRG